VYQISNSYSEINNKHVTVIHLIQIKFKLSSGLNVCELLSLSVTNEVITVKRTYEKKT